jgi:FAD binding domain
MGQPEGRADLEDLPRVRLREEAVVTGVASRRVREVPAKTDPAIPGAPRGSVKIDVAALKKALRAEVEGEVRFDPGSLAMYANDASNFRQVPIGVVIPRTLEDVVAAHRVCHRFGAPVLNRGGGTSLSGETVNYAVVIDHSSARARSTPRCATCGTPAPTRSGQVPAGEPRSWPTSGRRPRACGGW